MDAADPDDPAVTVTVEDGLYVAVDEETGVSSQGQSEEEALANLSEAVDSYREAVSEDEGDDWL